MYTVYSILSKSKYVSYIKERSVKEYINQRPSLFFITSLAAKISSIKGRKHGKIKWLGSGGIWGVRKKGCGMPSSISQLLNNIIYIIWGCLAIY